MCPRVLPSTLPCSPSAAFRQQHQILQHHNQQTHSIHTPAKQIAIRVMAPTTLYPRGTIKRITKAHTNRPLSKNVDILIFLDYMMFMQEYAASILAPLDKSNEKQCHPRSNHLFENTRRARFKRKGDTEGSRGKQDARKIARTGKADGGTQKSLRKFRG
jgi:hypothetical protein